MSALCLTRSCFGVQMPIICKNVGKAAVKTHLAVFVEALHYSLASQNALARPPAAQCALYLSKLLGPSIFKARVEAENAAYVPVFEAVLSAPPVQPQK
eukprot:m.254699 g.254699  ORF g.254699 m.254699 type:complete len:98 (+) comp54538_c0_seq11:2213-2506(+)